MPYTAPLTLSNLKGIEFFSFTTKVSEKTHSLCCTPLKIHKAKKIFFNTDYIFPAILSNMYYAKKLTESILLGLSTNAYIKENETNSTIYQQTLNSTSCNFTFFLRKTRAAQVS